MPDDNIISLLSANSVMSNNSIKYKYAGLGVNYMAVNKVIDTAAIGQRIREERKKLNLTKRNWQILASVM